MSITRTPQARNGDIMYDWSVELTKQTLQGHSTFDTVGIMQDLDKPDDWQLVSYEGHRGYPIVYPLTAEPLTVVSTSTEDNFNTAPATRLGVGQVGVFYTDDNNELQALSVNLNGTTPVSTGINARRVQFLGIRDPSTNAATTYTNVGIIRAYTTSGNLAVIPPMGGRSHTANYFVPVGYRASAVSLYIGTGDTVESIEFRIVTRRPDSGNGSDAWIPIFHQYMNSGPVQFDLRIQGALLQAKTDIQIQARALINNVAVSAHLFGVLMDEEVFTAG